ncbi:MAG: glycerol-3-phosphate 1-O-acyltransferase PlsY [Oscillospiraceae bacterium]
MNEIVAALLTALSGYLLGSLCFGVIFTRMFIHKDIRGFGSGNAGMTNVLRSVGTAAGALTGIGDFAKGAAAIIIGRSLFTSVGADPYIGACLGSMCALLGHLFPVYFGFKGGKGVMVSAGIMLVLNPKLLLVCGAVFALVFLISQIVSLSSLAASAACPIANFVISTITGSERIYSTALTLCMAAMIFYSHRENIKRLCAGTEKKLVIKK